MVVTPVRTAEPRPLYRVLRYLRKYGVRSALDRSVDVVRSRAVLDESHVWYELDLATEHPRVPLAEGYVVRRAEPAEADLVEALPTVSAVEARRRMAAGHELWLVLDAAGSPAFACWLFHATMPMLGGPGGVLTLPPGTLCLEDSVTSPDHRGRKLAPAAWSVLADDAAAQGVEALITKIGVENVASRKAIVKCGFTEIGTMTFRRTPWSRRSHLEGPVGRHAEALAAQLR